MDQPPNAGPRGPQPARAEDETQATVDLARSELGVRALRGPLIQVTFCAAILGLTWGDTQWALGIALGALVFALDLGWMQRHFSVVLSQASAAARTSESMPASDSRQLGDPPPRSSDGDLASPSKPRIAAVSTGIALRLPLVALALGGILWYMPARPEGVAIGVALVPLTMIWVGLRPRPRPLSSNSP